MHVFLAGIAGAIVLFIADGLLARVPLVVITRKEFESFEGVKKWGTEDRPFFHKALIMLAEGFLFAFAFAAIRLGLSTNVIVAAMQFWFVIAAVRIIPESLEFWNETNYPLPLIYLEAGIDAVTGLAAAFTYAMLIT